MEKLGNTLQGCRIYFKVQEVLWFVWFGTGLPGLSNEGRSFTPSVLSGTIFSQLLCKNQISKITPNIIQTYYDDVIRRKIDMGGCRPATAP